MGINAMQDCDDGIQLELQKLMDSEITVGAASFQLKYKVGVCRYPEHGDNARELVIKLWQTLSFAKNTARKASSFIIRLCLTMLNVKVKFLSC